MGLGYIEPIVFFYTIMLYINVPVEKQLIRNKLCLSMQNESICSLIFRFPEVEKVVTIQTAKWDMINNVVRTIPTIVSTILLGVWADSVGRKKLILIPLFGETVQAIGYFLNSWFIDKSVKYLLIGSAVTGMCGNLPTMLMTVFAYIADITTAQQRTTRMVVLDAVIFSASIISLFLGGTMLMKISMKFGLKYGFLAVYSVDLALLLFIFIYYLFLNESYFPNDEMSASKVCSVQRLREYAHLLTQKPGLYYRPKFFLLAGCFCFLFFVTTGVSEMIILYVLHTPLSFPPTDLGFVLASEAAVKFFGAMFLTFVAVRLLGWRDSSLILLCCVSAGGYAACLGLSHKHWHVYLSTVWGLGVSCGIAATRSGLSKLVSMEEQGRLSSFVCTLQEIMLLLVTTICNSIFSATERHPYFVMYVLAGVSIIPASLCLFLKVYDYKEAKMEKTETSINTRPSSGSFDNPNFST